MIQKKAFREDLFFRINVIPIYLPPLRERMEDVPLLIEAVIGDLIKRTWKPITGLSKSAMDLFLNYSWMGNVRELKSALEFAFVVAESGLIEPHHLPDHLLENQPHQETFDRSEEAEPEGKAALIAALKKADGNRTKAAKILGVTRATVWNRINKYNIKVEQGINVA